MWFKKLLRRKKEAVAEKPVRDNIDQGMFYVYLIVGVQILFVMGLVIVITAFGRVIATPLWVFAAAFLAGIAGCVYVYRKAREKLERI